MSGTAEQRKRVEDVAKASGWLDNYWSLRANKLYWKKAAYAAWRIAPKRDRQPATMAELAELLNYRSEQVFYKWHQQEWFAELGIDRLREQTFVDNLADVDRVTIFAALHEAGSPGVQARKLFYEQMQRARPEPDESDAAGDWWSAADGQT